METEPIYMLILSQRSKEYTHKYIYSRKLDVKFENGEWSFYKIPEFWGGKSADFNWNNFPSFQQVETALIESKFHNRMNVTEAN